jgi:hypothetical protein
MPLLGALIAAAACSAPGEAVTLELQVGNAGMRLLDGRPHHVPSDAAEALRCDPELLVLPPGWHHLHLPLPPPAGGDASAEPAARGAVRCGFNASPGHRYGLELQSNQCRILDEATGSVQLTGERSDRAHLELVRAFAACNDAAALRAWKKLREAWRDERGTDAGSPGDCEPFFDLR